jgi:hypothetical protein
VFITGNPLRERQSIVKIERKRLSDFLAQHNFQLAGLRIIEFLTFARSAFPLRNQWLTDPGCFLPIRKQLFSARLKQAGSFTRTQNSTVVAGRIVNSALRAIPSLFSTSNCFRHFDPLGTEFFVKPGRVSHPSASEGCSNSL